MDKYQWLPKHKLAAILLWGVTSLPRASVKDGTQDVPGNAGFRCRTSPGTSWVSSLTDALGRDWIRLAEGYGEN